MKRLSVKVSAPRIWYLCSCSFYNVWAFMPVDIIERYFSSLLGQPVALPPECLRFCATCGLSHRRNALFTAGCHKVSDVVTFISTNGLGLWPWPWP